MLTVTSHEYDAETGVDHYVFDPGNMKAAVRVVEENGEPQVLLGVERMAIGLGAAELNWTACRSKDIIDAALADYAARNA